MRPVAARRASGQVIVMFGLGLLVILLTVGLVVDGGTAFLDRRDGQNAADLAAVAGTKVIADAYMKDTRASRGAVHQAMSRAMQDNGCGPGGAVPCTWTARFIGAGQMDLGLVKSGDGGSLSGSSPAILGVRVDVSRRPRTYFLGLIGQSSWKVDTTATALTVKPTVAPAGQLLPIALKQPDVPFQAGQVYDVTAGKATPGGFTWLSWQGSPSSGVLHASLCAPDNQAITVGSSVDVGPVSAQPEDFDCFARWISSRATVLIPIYDKPSKDYSKVHVTGVAAFVIVSTGLPTHDDFRAYFVGSSAYPTLPAGAGNRPPDKLDSLYYLGLVR